MGIDVCRVGDNTVNCRKVPIIFAPGVMGSKIHFDGTLYTWDPDSKLAMSDFIVNSSEVNRQIMHISKKATVLTKAFWDGTTADEQARGLGGIVAEFYLGYLRTLKEMKFGATTPIYAVGYDWRKSNRQSAKDLDKKIGEILAKEKADTYLLISHSMGGLLTRAFLKEGSNASKALGVIHVVQPALGATVFYRRMYTGADWDADGGAMVAIMGYTAKDFALLLSGLPGPCELMPTDAYRDYGGKHWLCDERVDGQKGNWNSPIYHWYYEKATPPSILWSLEPPGFVKGLLEPASISTGQAYTDLWQRTHDAQSFHAWLKDFKHKNTFAVYCTGMVTDMAVGFESKKTLLGNHPEGGTYEVVYHRRPQGDGTVPSPSASALFPQSQTSADLTAFTTDPNIRQFVIKEGVDHAGVFGSALAQAAINQMLIVLLGGAAAGGGHAQNESTPTNTQLAQGGAPDNTNVAQGQSNPIVGGTPDPNDWNA